MTTPEKYLTALQGLLPPGPAWTREDDAELTALLLAIAEEAARVEQRALGLLEEVDPRTTTELVDDWMRVMGLPGPCDTPTTLQQKRDMLHAHLLGFGDPHKRFYIEYIEALGLINVTLLNRHEPFVPGSAAGSPLSNDPWQFTFRIEHDTGAATLNSRAACRLPTITPLHTHGIIHAREFDAWHNEIPDAGYSGAFQAIACNAAGDTFVAVGSGAEIQTSDGGGTWTEQSTSGSNDLFGVFFWEEESLWIAFGESGQIWTASSVGSWSSGTPDSYTGTFRGGAASQTAAVLVGASGGIQRSADGSTWAKKTAAGGYTGTFFGVAYGNGVFVAVGSSGQIQRSDDDGGTWSQASFKDEAAGNLRSVVFADGFFWVTSGAGIHTSRDGVDWCTMVLSFSGAEPTSMAFVGDGFLMADDLGGVRWFGVKSDRWDLDDRLASQWEAVPINGGFEGGTSGLVVSDGDIVEDPVSARTGSWCLSTLDSSVNPGGDPLYAEYSLQPVYAGQRVRCGAWYNDQSGALATIALDALDDGDNYIEQDGVLRLWTTSGYELLEAELVLPEGTDRVVLSLLQNPDAFIDDVYLETSAPMTSICTAGDIAFAVGVGGKIVRAPRTQEDP